MMGVGIRFIFCNVSVDSSSESLDLPPVDLRILAWGLGDLAEVGLARGWLGDAFSSVESPSIDHGYLEA